MANLKEIVTKAVIGKTKKASKEELTIDADSSIDTVLGCWVINHNFNGQNNNGKVSVEGNYDINVWYAYDNNTRTGVIVRNFYYSDSLNVKLKTDATLDQNTDIIVRSLKAPSVSDVKVENNQIKLTTEKEMGVEVVGDIKVRINVEPDIDDYDVDMELPDLNINENYLNDVN